MSDFGFTAGQEEGGARLDAAIAARTGLSRGLAQRLIRDGLVHLNGRRSKPSARLASGDRVEGEIVLPPPMSAEPEAIPLQIVYRDDDLAIVDKPAGLVVHPSAGHLSGTLANALMYHFPSARGVGPAERPGIVHRLDKDTSGLMVVALTDAARRDLQRQIAAREAGRRYLALADGRVQPTSGTIDAPIGRDLKDRKRMGVGGAGARNAVTRYGVLEHLRGFDYLEARLETGRTHQIRVHFAATGHPLAGDRLYRGAHLPGLHRQFLHAHELHLRSPSTGSPLSFTSPLPNDLQTVLDTLRRQTP